MTASVVVVIGILRLPWRVSTRERSEVRLASDYFSQASSKSGSAVCEQAEPSNRGSDDGSRPAAPFSPNPFRRKSERRRPAILGVLLAGRRV